MAMSVGDACFVRFAARADDRFTPKGKILATNSKPGHR